MAGMSGYRFDGIPIMWKPTGEVRESAEKFKKRIQKKYDVQFENYWEYQDWTIKHTEEFWSEVWDFLGIIYSQRFVKVVDLNTPMSERPKWFDGAKLNCAENLLKFRDDQEALILTGEERKTERVTYAQLFEHVKLYTSAFKKFGVKKGDVIVGYMSNREEPVYAMIAALSIGALWSGALPLLGARPVINRFIQVQPKILLTMDRFRHNKEEFEMLTKVSEISKELTSLEKVIIVRTRSKTKSEDIKEIKNSVFLEDFLRTGYNEDGTVPYLHFEQVSFSYPLFISYTSGTTGLPKALVHGSGVLLSMATQLHLYNDANRDHVILSVSPVGWASWNMLVMQIFSGVKLVLYEGVPFLLSPTYLWDLIDEFGITLLFVTMNLLDKMEKDGYVPTKKHSLQSLTSIASGGSVAKHKNYEFVYSKIKKDVIYTSSFFVLDFASFLLLWCIGSHFSRRFSSRGIINILVFVWNIDITLWITVCCFVCLGLNETLWRS